MTDKDFRKLNRTELLELLIRQTKENEKIKAQVLQRDARIADLEQQIQQRAIALEDAGSIAEASLRLNGIFEAADRAAKEYLDNIRLRYQGQEETAKRIEAETEEKVRKMLCEAEERCKTLETETAKKCEAMTERSRRESQEYWSQVSAKLDEYIRQRSDLRDLLSVNYRKL